MFLGIRWLNALGRVTWDGITKTVEFQTPTATIKWQGEAATRGSEATALNAISNGTDHLETWVLRLGSFPFHSLYRVITLITAPRKKKLPAPTTRLTRAQAKAKAEAGSPFGCLMNYLGPDAPASFVIPSSSLVSDVISPEGWSLPHAHSYKVLQVLSFITTIQPTPVTDSTQWCIGDKIYNSYISKDIWNTIREAKPQVPWFLIIWHKALVPKHALLSWLFQSCLYEILRERNNRYHNGLTPPTAVVPTSQKGISCSPNEGYDLEEFRQKAWGSFARLMVGPQLIVSSYPLLSSQSLT
ncbi:unnamed protein product [Thlaspi arvense]|uniref:Reverse transcriptase zinc-binding domain-containing protein n=1 Tax=Thlaspi arvense TaxID=13288 RepID=A0AAU9T4U7_THLAR|nr:unnamed protein product [Thlaspi arvense]